MRQRLTPARTPAPLFKSARAQVDDQCSQGGSLPVTCFRSLLLVLACTGSLAAQMTTQSSDVLGAHLNYGRGCIACHSPHSGASGNGQSRQADPSSGAVALWGEDASALYGKTLTTGGGKFVEVLPSSMAAGTPDVAGILTCLSC